MSVMLIPPICVAIPAAIGTPIFAPIADAPGVVNAIHIRDIINPYGPATTDIRVTSILASACKEVPPLANASTMEPIALVLAAMLAPFFEKTTDRVDGILIATEPILVLAQK